MKAYITCIGCEQRELDTQRIIDYLRKNNVLLTPSPQQADYSLVITCAVDSSNEERSIGEIRKVTEQMQEGSKLIVGGCLPSISPEKLAPFNVYEIFSPRDLQSLDRIFNPNISILKIPSASRSIYDQEVKRRTDLSAREKFERAKNGYKVIIASGCLGVCSYCVIREATGRLESRPLEEVLSNIIQGINGGERTIMLMAGDTGSYGQDRGINFAQLLNKAVKLEGEFQIYVHDFGINWLIKDQEDYLFVFESSKKEGKIGGITFPIQSGSDQILRRMNRRYTREETLRTFLSLKPYSFDIGTHIMIGFPEETENNFEETLDLLQQVDFDFITCFAYSEHPRAKSASLKDKVDRDTIEKRIARISNAFGNKIKVMR
ncbi:MAG: radical SAM protein [Candidatus Woesearchaeota archaeon]